MNFLRNAVEKIRGGRCEKLVKRSGSEITLSTSVEAGGFRMNVGNSSNVIKELVRVPDTAVALDDTQYHLCIAISDMKDITQLREKCMTNCLLQF